MTLTPTLMLCVNGPLHWSWHSYETCMMSWLKENENLRGIINSWLRVRSHWATNIAINSAIKFATKFATKNEMGLIPIFATKYLWLSNFLRCWCQVAHSIVYQTHLIFLTNAVQSCSLWVWYQIERGTLHGVTASMSYSQTQTQILKIFSY